MTTKITIPTGWKEISVENIFTFIKSHAFSRENLSSGIFSNNGIGNIHYGDIHSTFTSPSIDLNVIKVPMVKDQSFNPKKEDLLMDGDLIIADASEDYAGIGVSVSIHGIKDKKVVGGLHTFVLRDKKGLTDEYFRQYIFKSPIVRNKLQKTANGVSVYGISKAVVSKMTIFLPPLPEQEKIVKVIETWDSYLEKLSNTIKLKKKVKKGLMQKLLTGKMRLNDFSETWKTVKLEEACEINPKSEKLPSDFVYIDLESVEKGILKKERPMKLEGAPSRAQRLLQRKDILFQMVRPYQKNNFYFIKDGDYIASTGYAQIRTQNNPEFLYQILHTDNFVNKVLEKCTGSNYPAINSTDLSKIKIPLPSLTEQTAIAQILTTADQEIEALEQKKTLIGQQKKFLLNNMITGKLRLPEFTK